MCLVLVGRSKCDTRPGYWLRRQHGRLYWTAPAFYGALQQHLGESLELRPTAVVSGAVFLRPLRKTKYKRTGIKCQPDRMYRCNYYTWTVAFGRRRLIEPPLRPATCASSLVHLCAVPSAWAAFPPLLAISRFFSGLIDAKPRP